MRMRNTVDRAADDPHVSWGLGLTARRRNMPGAVPFWLTAPFLTLRVRRFSVDGVSNLPAPALSWMTPRWLAWPGAETEGRETRVEIQSVRHENTQTIGFLPFGQPQGQTDHLKTRNGIYDAEPAAAGRPYSTGVPRPPGIYRSSPEFRLFQNSSVSQELPQKQLQGELQFQPVMVFSQVYPLGLRIPAAALGVALSIRYQDNLGLSKGGCDRLSAGGHRSPLQSTVSIMAVLGPQNRKPAFSVKALQGGSVVYNAGAAARFHQGSQMISLQYQPSWCYAKSGVGTYGIMRPFLRDMPNAGERAAGCRPYGIIPFVGAATCRPPERGIIQLLSLGSNDLEKQRPHLSAADIYAAAPDPLPPLGSDGHKQRQDIPRALAYAGNDRTFRPEFFKSGPQAGNAAEIIPKPAKMMEMISQLIERRVTEAIRKQSEEGYGTAPESTDRSPIPEPDPPDMPLMPEREHSVSEKQARLYLRQIRKMAEEEHFRLGLLR